MSRKSLPSHTSLQVFIAVTVQVVVSDTEDGSSIFLLKVGIHLKD
jgi:hypothetical protein